MTTERRHLTLYGGHDPRDVPAYSVAEASRLVQVPVATLRAWVRGQPRKGNGRSSPVIERPSADPRLSFTNLVEAYVLSSIRTHRIPLERVRTAITYVRTRLDVPHPLASDRFMTDGVDLFVDHLGELISASRNGQVAMKEVLRKLLRRIEVDEHKLATRFYPVLRKTGTDGPKSVMVDPRIAFGRPVVAGTGIPIAVLHQRWKGGESFLELATDYGIAPELVEDALRCEDCAAA